MNKINISEINNHQYRLFNHICSNFKQIKVKLVSDNIEVNRLMFQKLQEFVTNEKAQKNLMKSAMKTIKDQIYRKND